MHEVREWEQQEQLQAYLDGELGEAERQVLEAQLEAEPELLAAFAELESENQWTLHRLSVFVPEVPPVLDVAEVYARYEHEQRGDAVQPAGPSQARKATNHSDAPWWKRVLMPKSPVDWGWVLGGAVCCLVLLLQLPAPLEKARVPVTPRPVVSSLYTQKGLLIQMIHAHRKKGTQKGFTPTRETRRGARLFGGDLIQFLYTFRQTYHIMIVNINKRGDVFPLLPSEKGQSVAFSSGTGTVPAKGSFILDDDVGLESYFVVLSLHPFSFSRLQAALQQAWKRAGGDIQALSLPRRWFYKSFLIRKAPAAHPKTPTP